MNQSFDHAALLIEARRWQCAALYGIKYSKEMLAFAKNNLRCPHGFALCGTANQIRTSHISITPNFSLFARRSRPLNFASSSIRTQVAWPSTAFWHCDKIATGRDYAVSNTTE
jgi:hypothetical protein